MLSPPGLIRKLPSNVSAGPSRLKQDPGKRLFVAKAEDPCLLCLDDGTLGSGEPRSAVEERRKATARIQPREGLCVYSHLDTINDFLFILFALTLIYLLLEQ